MTAPIAASEKEQQLLAEMDRLGIQEADLRETFVRSGGPGGQHLNKTSTCVLLVHVPSGVQVRCQTTRYQGQNRVLAREMLVKKIKEQREAKAAREVARQEKLRRQTRRPSRRARQRMLETKNRRADKKQNRKPVQDW